MKGRLIFVAGDVQHFVCHVLPQVFVSGMIDRFVQRKPDGVQQGLHTESVEFQPDVFPRQLLVGNISGDLIGEDHEPLHAFDRVGLGDTLAVVCHQCAGARQDIVKQIVVSRSRSERVCRCTAFPPELEQAEVYKVLIGKN